MAVWLQYQTFICMAVTLGMGKPQKMIPELFQISPVTVPITYHLKSSRH